MRSSFLFSQISFNADAKSHLRWKIKKYSLLWNIYLLYKNDMHFWQKNIISL